ncbi:hypothetical protein CMK19_08200 [Candidatus Poribacteria bacterium]|nr:hypothetical protein [Candidatus Poribacteria bacterium]|tara:strand:- start:2585 stop:3061 length:477 start_codon:yes stop_codon:yes gene_type:complete
MIPVEVAFVSVDAAGSPVVFLRNIENEKKRLLPIWIGQSEAIAIHLQLKDELPPRPFAHDLMKNIIEALSATIDSIYVHSLKDRTFFALINLTVGQETLQIDARPSDSIALALRSNAPIFVEEEIIAKNSFAEDDLVEKKETSSLEDLDDDDLGRFTV